MSYDAKTERLISIKKLSGKAQTSNEKGLINEGLPSGLTLSYNTKKDTLCEACLIITVTVTVQSVL